MEASGPRRSTLDVLNRAPSSPRCATAFRSAVVIGAALISFGCSSGNEPAAPDGIAQTENTAVAADPATSEPIPTSTTAATAPVISTIGNQPLSLRGMGSLITGMTIAEATAELGLPVTPFADDGLPCQYAYLEGDDNSPRLMVIAEDGVFPLGKVVRIDLNGSQATRSGIRIGSTKADVLAAYGDQIVATPHKYTFAEGGEYLTFVPRDAADGDYRLVMETANDVVTQIRSGLIPYVEFVEGCS